MMEWVWDDDKEAGNKTKHGLSFKTAVLVFEDDYRVSIPDPHLDDDRWRTIGMVDGATLFVVHTLTEHDEAGRIISARRATPNERKLYEKLYFQGNYAGNKD